MIREVELKDAEYKMLGYMKIDIANAEEGEKNNLPKNINVLDFNFLDVRKLLPEVEEEEAKNMTIKQHEIDRLILKKEHSCIDVVRDLKKISVRFFLDDVEYLRDDVEVESV